MIEIDNDGYPMDRFEAIGMVKSREWEMVGGNGARGGDISDL